MTLNIYTIWGAVIIIVVGIMGTVVVVITRPSADTVALMASMFASIITVALAMLSAQRSLHIQMNSRMTEMLRVTRAQGVAEGQITGRAFEKAEKESHDNKETVVIEADTVDVNTTKD